jgi:hypothetical protein
MKAPGWFVFASILLSPLAHAVAIEPFQASFAVSRNGKELGVMQMQLTHPRPGEALFVSRTEGKGGLAGFLGVTIDERSELNVDASRISTRSYRYKQQMVGRKRARELDVAADGSVSEVDNGKSWTYRAADAVLDRHAVVLGIAAKLADGVPNGSVFDLPVASKGEAENWRFLVVGDELVETGNGRMQAIRVERVRENAERKTVSWHAVDYGFLPIKVEQIEPDGERLVSVLQTFEQGGTPAIGRDSAADARNCRAIR